MKRFAYTTLALATLVTALGLVPAGDAQAGINVNESGNAVLCKGKKSCGWLKTACGKEGGTYAKGSGGTGKCNFPSKQKFGFSAAPAGGKAPAKRSVN